MDLHESLTVRVRGCRDTGYPDDRHRAIAEILAFAIDGDGPQAPLRYLRVFEVGTLDVPARKRDLVEGTYEIEVDAASPDPIAGRITDMAGGAILVGVAR